MIITINSYLLLVPLNVRNDNKRYIVEDTNSGEFYEMSKVCIDAIEMVNSGQTLEEIEKVLKKTYPEDEVDLLDFAQQLLELQLVSEIDGVKVNLAKNKTNDLGCLWINQRIGKLFFNKISRFLYLVLFGLIIFLLFLKPSLFPQYKDIFVFELMVFNILTWLIISIVLVLCHELGHVLAMRSYNLPTKLELGNRLFLVVLETEMSSVWKLPSKDRNVLYLAGLCFDTAMLFIALICQLAFPNGPEIFLGILKVIVFDIVVRMVYQCCIYMKTDLYYVFENVTGCYNLMENAQEHIKSWIPMKQSPTNSTIMFKNERTIVSVYSIFYFLGVFLSMSLFVIYYIPQLLFAWKHILPGFLDGPSTYSFWDAVLFSVQILVGVGLLLYSWRKTTLHNKQPSGNQ